MFNYTGLIVLILFFALLYFIKEKYNEYIINNYSFLEDITKEEEIIKELKSNSFNDVIVFILKKIKKWGALSLKNNVFQLNENVFFSFLLNKYIVLFYNETLNLYNETLSNFLDDIKMEIYKLNKINNININNAFNSFKINENIEIISDEKRQLFLKKDNNFYLLKLVSEEKDIVLLYKSENEVIKIKSFKKLKNLLNDYL